MKTRPKTTSEIQAEIDFMRAMYSDRRPSRRRRPYNRRRPRHRRFFAGIFRFFASILGTLM